uniref:Galectin n=1 Tax=Acrobeloides nanus TaxID=290746 RepID=A0A914E3F4_9BILA
MTRGEDLCFGIHYCDSLIISAAGSTFAWWIGYLKKSDGPVFYNSQITKPSDDFNLYMSKKIFDYEGFPKEWIRLALNNNSIVVDNKWFYEKLGRKINISDPIFGHALLRRVKEPIKPGQTLIVQGYTCYESRRFTINFHKKSVDFIGDDLPLHISVRFDELEIVFNSLLSDQWGKEERKKSPFFPGDNFDIRIRAHDHKFEIFVDRKPFFEYFYRLPLNEITHFSVSADTDLSKIHWSGKYYAIPHETTIPGGFATGKRLLIFGQVKEKAMSFNISLLHKSGDIALHFNPRFDKKAIIRNDLTHGTWGREEREGKNVFEKGSLFDMLIDNTKDSFKIMINDHYYADFAHRTGAHAIHGLRIEGDVEVSGIQIMRTPINTPPVKQCNMQKNDTLERGLPEI